MLFVFLAWAPAAYAWSWPVQGPVLRPFAYDRGRPYTPGQHRGIDIGAGSAGETVVAPAAGTVSFAGTVPTNGRSVTIEAGDGYSVTLTHLGAIEVAKGAAVAEGDAIGTVGPSGTPELAGPYVHLGVRVTADPDGYVDPLGLLPQPSGSDPNEEGATAQPVSSGAVPAAPASKPASPPTRTRVAVTGQSHARARRAVQEPRSDAPATRSRLRRTRAAEEQRPRGQHDRAERPTTSSRRPVVEPAAPRPIGLDAGHAIRPSVLPERARRDPSRPVLGLVCNGAAALVAVGAAIVAGRRRRRRRTHQAVGAQVLQLAQPAVAHRRFSRAA